MTPATRNLLVEWAGKYESETFIPNDPVQFPHRFSRKQDIEIAGLLTAWISFGNRKMICRKADELLVLMQHRPLEYVAQIFRSLTDRVFTALAPRSKCTGFLKSYTRPIGNMILSRRPCLPLQDLLERVYAGGWTSAHRALRRK
jgi:hypothetical protein